MGKEKEVYLEEDNQEKKNAKAYDESFTGEEKVLHKLTNIKSKVKVNTKEIEIDDILTSSFKKVSRSDSVTGLAGVVAEWGVVTPIHVLALEDDDSYQLLDGLRRVFAALRAGEKTITAKVWDFSDKAEGKEIANLLSLMVNRTQVYTPKEQWEQMKILESTNNAAPGLIEYLLQMNAGDAMKLKDVMLAEDTFEECRDGLVVGKYDIDKAYKRLTNMRKKEDKLEKEDTLSVDSRGLKESEILQGYTEDSEEYEEVETLDSEEVKDILELSDVDKDTSEMDIDDLDRTDEIRKGKDELHQEVGKRKYIDQSVKKATLIRDDFKCRACGLDGKSGMYLGILVYHHSIPVYAGGPDTVENGLTLCSNCHITLHNYLMGKVQINKELMSEEQKEIFKNIFKFGNIAIEATKRKGISKKEVEEENKAGARHMMPGEGLKANIEALNTSLSKEIIEGSSEDTIELG